VLHAGARAAELVAYPAVRAGRKQMVLFDVDPGSPAIRQHVHAGGCAYVLDGGWVTQLKDCYKVRVVPVSELDRGPAQWRVADALAAVAAAVAHGLSPTTIRRRLATLDVPERVEAAATVIRFETVLPDPSRPDAGAPVAIREAA